MLQLAGATDIQSELEPWSAPENFWRVRKDREVTGHLGYGLYWGIRPGVRPSPR